jgi:glycosyltransferase involved in cell wall biosynthesis
MKHENNNSMVRVLHCIHSLSGGGAERQLKLIANISRSVGINSAIFCVNDAGNDIHDPTVKIYKSKRANKYNLSIFSSLNRAINNFNPNIVHLWLPEVVTIPAMLVSFMNRIPCVHSYRNMMRFRRPLSVLDFIVSIITTSGIISNNPVSQSSLLYRLLFKIKSGIVISNAVNINSVFRRTCHNKPADQPHKILFVGRITKQKNLGCLLKALPSIESRFKWELAICGEGEEQPETLKLIDKLKIGDRVKLLGYCTEIYSIMQKADVLILPSKYEGMPNILLEALEIGLPCIVSNIPAHANIIGHHNCALTFDPTSPTDLARTINRFFNDETIGQILVQAGWNVAKVYNPERMATLFYDYYSDILKGYTMKLNERD